MWAKCLSQKFELSIFKDFEPFGFGALDLEYTKLQSYLKTDGIPQMVKKLH
jgi:hypothetical protein